MSHTKILIKTSRQAAHAIAASAIFTWLSVSSVAQTPPPKTDTKPLKSLFQESTQQSTPKPPASQLAPPNAKLTSQETIAEIEALRKRMGGGVGERLKGLIPGVDPDANFRQELENLTRPTAGKRANNPQNAQLASPATQPSTNRRLPNPPPQRFRKIPRTPMQVRAPQASQQDVLRSSAADLERIAAAMEAAKLYQQADQLRSAAASFWQKARDLD